MTATKMQMVRTLAEERTAPAATARERNEAVALLRAAEWRLRAKKRNDLAERNDAVHADHISARLSRFDAGAVRS